MKLHERFSIIDEKLGQKKRLSSKDSLFKLKNLIP